MEELLISEACNASYEITNRSGRLFCELTSDLSRMGRVREKARIER